MKSINVYIDGACSNNGKPNALAGYGVFFSDDDPRNESQRVIGKQSNNTGELTAFIRSLEILDSEIQKNITIHLYTDSEYVVKCVTTYGKKLQNNDWKTANNKTPPNIELIKKAFSLFQKSKSVKLHHIEAHTGKEDIHSIGNAKADKLACLSIGKNVEIESRQSSESNNILKLDWISFHNKNKAKELGAKWNVKNKFWYIEKPIESEKLRKLNELKQEKVDNTLPNGDVDEPKKYVKVSFADKNKAKGLGAKWDPSVKSWYYLESQISSEKKKELLKLS